MSLVFCNRVFKFLFLVFTFVFSSTPVWGRKSIEFRQSVKTREPIPQVQESLSKQVEERSFTLPSLPSKSYQILRSPREDYNRYQEILDQQILETRKLLQKKPSDSAHRELLLRLGSLYVEKADLTRIIIDQRFEANFKKDGKSSPNYESAKPYNKAAIRVYEEFAKKYPDDRRMDQVLYFIGYNKFELGDFRSALEHFNRLEKQFSRSPYITETKFLLAEYYFDENQFQKAKNYYEKVLSGKNLRLAKFALYKRAWCHYKLNQPSRGIMDLEKIITQEASQAPKPNELRLSSEAKRDMVLFYSEAGDPRRAVDYFVALMGEQDSQASLEKLAYLYYDRGVYSAARSIFKYLIRKNPTHKKAFEYQYQLVRGLMNSKNVELFKSELKNWVENFGPSSAWYRSNLGNKELIENSSNLLESTVRKWTLLQHQTAQNSRGTTSQKLAFEGYRLYFDHFKESPYMVEMRFYFGELLYDMNRFEEASQQYRWVVDKGGNTKYRPMAAVNLLISAEKSLPSEKELIEKAEKANKSKIVMSSAVLNYINQAEWFLSQFPNDEKRPEIEFRLARLHYLHNDFDPAVSKFRKIIQHYPTTRYAEYSANLLLDIYNINGDMEGLKREASLILSVPAIARSKTGHEVHSILEKADFKKASVLEGENRFEEAAREYEAFASRAKDPELITMALFNAAVNWDKVGHLGHSRVNLIKVLKRNDTKAKSLRIKSQKLLYRAYLDSGQLVLAASVAKDLVNSYEKPQEKAEALYSIGLLYEALEQPQKAQGVYEEYFKIPTRSKDTSAWYRLAELYREQGHRSAAITHYEKFIRESAKSSHELVWSCYYLMELKKLDPETELNRCISLFRRLDSEERRLAASAIAKIHLKLLKSMYNRLTSIRLNNPQTQAKKLSEKNDILDRINKKADEIVKLDAPRETLEAISVVGDSNLNIYNEMINAPLPSGLKPEQVQEYKSQVREIAKTPLSNAIASYEFVLQKARSYDFFSEVTLEAHRRLTMLVPDSYPNHEVMSVDGVVLWMH